MKKIQFLKVGDYMKTITRTKYTDAMEKLLQETDLLYFDWKVSTEEDAKKLIGGSLVPILNNLALADKKGVRTVLRCPIIPGVNDNTVHFQTICDLLGRYPSIDILLWRTFWANKKNDKEIM